MSTQQEPKTLFEIVNDILLQYIDANLVSEQARHSIADAICTEYYSTINPFDYDSDIPEEYSEEFDDDLTDDPFSDNLFDDDII